jgi:hypothetical protein
MTPQEKDLIQGVFDRLAAHQVAKDAEADALIRDRAQRQPDSVYGLVQAVVMLEAGLNQAQARINELQRQLEQAQGGQPAGGSFLGGGPWGGASVPRSGPQQGYAPPPQGYAPPPPAAPAASPWAQPSGGSFLRNAATMAAGVAGGTLIAEGISSLLGGRHYGGFGGFAGGYGGPGEVVENVTVNNYYDDRGLGQDRDVDTASLQDASYDDGSFDSGGFDDGFDV